MRSSLSLRALRLGAPTTSHSVRRQLQSTLATAHSSSPANIGRGVFASKKISDCTLGRTAMQLSKVPSVGYIYLGANIGYCKALELQQRFVRKRIDQIYASVQSRPKDDNRLVDVVFLLQHAPVYTNGRRNHGKMTDAEIERLLCGGQAEYVETNRGGEITFHGPGQLVVYPVMHLRDHYLATRCFVEGLENTVIETCARYAVGAHRLPGFPGVWTSDTQKVAALGTRCQRYVTSHGVALNCSTDLQWFGRIIPCGLDGKTATSLERILRNRYATAETHTSVECVLPVVLDSFATVFGCDIVPLEQLSPTTFSEIQRDLASIE
ncbi:hypothetical protein IW140_001890 [Coemansia sp. RSA 1813]|nr:hypothetical protein EV178_005060 [Coemansia sp. RSA 1646]KAJ1769927.1 hypothetical protein LPJ74_003648 [Coemansia sp. RSA 1843]KAJ2087265.1 hypothetical protein IW138_005111 [Coemansia sp. RSA 986]KAJ2212076.1 hypothetical protein EV179_004938 [Coemansia sp. RSA 487]KAJ2570936.1 hypothetical protein IW140_001890 [Coemansia sp. RSA 1813]